MSKKIDRKACFRIRDQWYDCMKSHTAELFESNENGTFWDCALFWVFHFCLGF